MNRTDSDSSVSSSIFRVRRRARRAVARLVVLGCAAAVLVPPAGAGAAETVAVKGPLAPHAASPAVAHIRAASGQVFRLMVEVDSAMKGGTGFLVSGRRVIATNHHVVDGGTAFWLGFLGPDGRAKRIPMRLLAIYPQKDLALLEALDEVPGRPLALSTQHPAAGSDIYAIGYPAAADPPGISPWSEGGDESHFKPSVLRGTVSRVLTNRWVTSQIQHQTPIVPGYSGGPLLNDEGMVVGISTSIHREANGISYGVLAADLAELTAACALPADSDRVAMRSGPQPEGEAAAADGLRVNTYAVEPRAPAADDFAALRRAETMLRNGSLNEARLMCQHLVSTKQMPEAYICLGKTYDPEVLKDLPVVGISGNTELAQFYYTQARTRRQRPVVPAERPEALTKPLAAPGDRRCEASLCKLVNRPGGPEVSCERRAVR